MSPDARIAGSPLDEALQRLGGPPLASVGLPPWELDTALLLALRLAELPTENLAHYREAMFTEVRRRLFPQTFSPPSADAGLVATFFFPLAGAVIEEQVRHGGGGTAVRLPFVPLADSDITPWPSGEEYRRLLRVVEHDGLLACLAMAQEWFGLSILDHVLGVTGLALHLGRQLARAVPVDLPLLHGAAIGHDIGKFGCSGDDVKRIPRLHYYYTHIWYQDRNLPSLGHIATNHSCWDLEQVRLPIETLLLIYADFRVKEWPGPDGGERMRIISLREAYDAIRAKLESLDKAKARRYQGVYRKLRDLEEYLQYLGVGLDAPGLATREPTRPRLPQGLDLLAVMAGRVRPDAVALATGSMIPSLRRLLVTAHDLGVMERLRDVPALRALLEEARSFEHWRDVRTYQTILGEYSRALSTEQKGLALDFFIGLLSHPDDDIRYHAANRIGDLLAGEGDFWRKDLPEGVVLRQEKKILDELGRVLALLDQAGPREEEDMAPTERVLYAIPIVVRRVLRWLDPSARDQAWELVRGVLRARLADRRPLVGLYVCEACEVSLPYLQAGQRRELVEFAGAWAHHEAANTRLMAWRVLLALSRLDRQDGELLAEVRGCVEDLGGWASGRSLVAELHVLAELAERCGLTELSKRCQDEQVDRRDPIREVFLRNLKSRVGWVEKKINCDYLTEVAYRRHAESHDPESYFANEVASHFANMLKVSRVEGTRFHAGRCLLRLLPLLSVPQRNELAVELLRSLELDAEAVTRYIPRFLGSVAAYLPEQEFLEVLEDIESNVRRGGEALQQLLLQTVGWVILSIDVERLRGEVLRRLIGVLLGALAESRASTVNESFAQLAMVLERLSKDGPDDGRLREIHLTATKKLLSLITHRPGDRVRFFLVASALSHLERAVSRSGRGPRFPERPSVALIPGTFDPFTAAHQAIVGKALESADEALVQMDDYSWRKHALPREQREELAWMALASVPNAFLAPFRPPVNLASVAGLRQLRRLTGSRKLSVVVGSDVVVGASAYANARSPIWDLPHVVIVREGEEARAWEEKIDQFRHGVAVVSVPANLHGVSSTSLRATLDRHEDPDALCHPLVSRTILERNLYVNYPAHKQVLPPPQQRVVVSNDATRLPKSMQPIAVHDLPSHGGDGKSRNRWSGVLMPTDGNPEAALIWRVLSAAALPAVVGDVGLPPAGGQRLLGEGALIESIARSGPPRALEHLFAEVIAHWLDSGLLFALAPVPDKRRADLLEALSLVGASLVQQSGTAANAPEWAVLRLAEPLVLVWDLESVLQPSYAASLPVRRALEENRHAMARFFASSRPGEALLHLQEEHLRRRVAEWARHRLAEVPSRRRVVLGLGRQFSRDIVGDAPTLAVDLERFLTWQGYEGGVHPRWGSPRLELQLAVAREIATRAILLVPFLESAEPVLQVAAAARTVGLSIDEVLVGVTDASARATLELRGIQHRCGVVVPGWRGVLRESLVAPYLGGWSIVGRAPLAAGSLLPSLNDCLPYHYPHHLGLDEREALDFSTLALQLTRHLLLAVEEAFREAEGRLLSVHELGAVVRSPRCPPFPQGFVPPRERFASELLAEDIEALARLHPESHAAHRGGWRGE